MKRGRFGRRRTRCRPPGISAVHADRVCRRNPSPKSACAATGPSLRKPLEYAHAVPPALRPEGAGPASLIGKPHWGRRLPCTSGRRYTHGCSGRKVEWTRPRWRSASTGRSERRSFPTSTRIVSTPPPCSISTGSTNMSALVRRRDLGSRGRAGRSHGRAGQPVGPLQVARFGVGRQRPLLADRIKRFSPAALLRGLREDPGPRRLAHRRRAGGRVARGLDPGQGDPGLFVRVTEGIQTEEDLHP